MKIDEVRYFYNEKEDIIGKCVGYSCCILKDNKWVSDKGVLGYGFSESFEKNGFKEINYCEIRELIVRQVVNNLIDYWNNKYEDNKKKWDENPLWPAKLVSTEFELMGLWVKLDCSDVCEGVKRYPEGFMEFIQNDMKEDLEKIGATHIINYGFLD